MPTPITQLGRLRPLSTQQERDTASAAVERLMDAGLTYAEATAAVLRCRHEPRRSRAFRVA
jgi:hypothetical protein